MKCSALITGMWIPRPDAAQRSAKAAAPDSCSKGSRPRALRKPRQRLGWTLTALLSLPLYAAAELWPWPADPLLSNDRQNHPPHLLWLNAEGERLNDGALQLSGGQVASLQLPAAGYLRLQLGRNEQPPALWLSVDGRLWQQADWQRSSTDDEWLLVEEDAPARFARLHASSAVHGRLLIATRQSLDLQARRMALPGLASAATGMQPPLRALQLTDSAGTAEFGYRLPADQMLTLPVDGPALLAIGSRPLGDTPSSVNHSLQWQLDDGPWQVLMLSQAASNPTYDRVGQCLLPGTLQRRHVAIPPGAHELRLQAAEPLMLTPEQTDPQPLLLNQAAALQLQPPYPTGSEPPISRLPSLDALRQSNHLQEAASTALASLRPAPGSESVPAAEELRLLIERSQRSYRNLLPLQLTTDSEIHSAWFAAARPLQFAETSLLYLAAKGPISGLSQGAFVPLGAQPLAYPLPARRSASQLRLAVAMPDAALQGQLQIQFDDQPPRHLQLQVLPGPGLQASAQDARLSALGSALPSLGADFARQHRNGHYWRVASSELELPAGVRTLRIQSSQPLHVAAQLRVDQPFYLDEQSYRALLRQIPGEQLSSSLQRAAQRIAVPAADSSGSASAASAATQAQPLQSTPEQALHNQWYPLLRYLQAASAVWLDDLDAQATPVAQSETARRLQRAETAARQADWPAVVEALGTLGYGHDLRAYQLSQQALSVLSENALARHQVKAAALYGSDPRSRSQARADLLGQYASSQDHNARVALLATLFLRGDNNLLPLLGQALLDNGEPLWATQIGLVLAQQNRSPDWLPSAAMQAGWNNTADAALDQLPAAQQALQRGDQALLAADLPHAQQYWKQAGEAGTSRHLWLQQGQAIAAGIASHDAQVREAAISRWLDRELTAGPDFHWNSLDEQVRRAAGHTSLFSEVSRNILALPRASVQQPVELEVIGPTLLRVQARQLLDGAPQPDWLLVEIGGRTMHYPVNARAVTPYLQPLAGSGSRQQAVTVASEVLVPVPAGLQRIRLYPRKADLLLQLAQWQAPARGGPLPPLTPLTLRAALAGTPAADQPHTTGTAYQLVGDCRLQPVPLLTGEQLYSHQLPGSATLQNALQRLHFPTGDMPAGWPPGSLAVDLSAPAGATDDAETAFRHAVSLLWRLEAASPAESPDGTAATAQIARLAQEWPQLEALQAIYQRASAGYQWEPLFTAYESAGVRPLAEHSGLHSPYRRVRDSLLPDISRDALWLQGHEVQGVSLSSPTPLRLQVQLRQPALPYSKTLPARVWLQVNDQPPRRINLNTG